MEKHSMLEGDISAQKDLRDAFELICERKELSIDTMKKSCDIKGNGMSLSSMQKFCKSQKIDLNLKYSKGIFEITYSYDWKDPEAVEDTITKNLEDNMTMTPEEEDEAPDFLKP